jgi:hypothetical protein
LLASLKSCFLPETRSERYKTSFVVPMKINCTGGSSLESYTLLVETALWCGKDQRFILYRLFTMWWVFSKTNIMSNIPWKH